MKREHGNGIQTDYLVVKKFGWKRIAKNKQRFGWILRDAVKETTITESTSYEGRVSGDTIYVTPKTTSTSKIRVNLTFLRDKNQFENLGSIKLLEFIYNIIFLLRRVLAFFVPLILAAGFVLFFFNFVDAATTVLGAWFAVTAVWLVFIILEGIFARIAARILRYKEQ